MSDNSNDNEFLKKIELLRKIDDMEQKGVKLPKTFNIEEPIESLIFGHTRLQKEYEKLCEKQNKVLFSSFYDHERVILPPLDNIKKKYNYVMQRETIMQEELDNIIKTKIVDKERLTSKDIDVYSLDEYNEIKFN